MVVGALHGKTGGMCGRGECVAGEMSTAPDGRHPTGMHSCKHNYVN